MDEIPDLAHEIAAEELDQVPGGAHAEFGAIGDDSQLSINVRVQTNPPNGPAEVSVQLTDSTILDLNRMPDLQNALREAMQEAAYFIEENMAEGKSRYDAFSR